MLGEEREVEGGSRTRSFAADLDKVGYAESLFGMHMETTRLLN